MQAHQSTTYESWNLAIPKIPPRSHLYHLEPIGVGTPLVESLTGYITRLAEVHCLPTGILILSKIAPLIKEEYEFRIKAGLTRIDSIKAINGNRSTATNWVLALETLTLGSNLHVLTMLTWANVLSSQGLLRRFRAWCPACYQEWRAVGQVIYDPLIWALNVVKVCPLHYQCLQIQCPNCHKNIPQLTWSSRPGYCSSCKGWLGLPLEAKASNSEAISENELKWQIWVWSNIKELIAITSHLSASPTRTTIKKVISAYVNSVFNGNVKALANLLEMDRTTVRSWVNGTSIPTLDSCLKFGSCFGISVADFLTKEVVINSASLITQSQAKEKRQQRKAPEKFNLQQARSILESALNEYPPVPLEEIVRRIGQSSSFNFRRNYPDLCRAVSSRYADYKKAKSLSEMQSALIAVQQSNEYPPPSMTEVTRRLKFKKSSLYKYFPDLCHAISARHRSYRTSVSEEHKEKIRSSIRQIAFELHAEGVKPTCTKIGERLPKPAVLRRIEGIAAFREVQRELGYKQ